MKGLWLLYYLLDRKQNPFRLPTMVSYKARQLIQSSYSYAHIIGDWAKECSENHGVSHATWYSSRVYVRAQDHYAKCSWIDKNGDQPSTGFQIHWPEFDGDTASRNTGYYCNSRPTLHWYTEPDPTAVSFFTRKRDMFARAPSCSVSESPEKDQSGSAIAKRKTGSSEQFGHQLVKSLLPGQTASELCDSRSSAGPSFVSYEERSFCFMLTKTLFPFCEDVNFGLCWSDELNLVTPKLIDSLVPSMNFTSIGIWDESNVDIFG